MNGCSIIQFIRGNNRSGEDSRRNRVRVSLSDAHRSTLLSRVRASRSEFPGERRRKSKVLFCFRGFGLPWRMAEQVYGLCGNIYLKRPLRYGRTELSVRPRGEPTRAVKDDVVGRLGFRKCRVSLAKSPKTLLGTPPRSGLRISA